jgi:Ribosomal protein L13
MLPKNKLANAQIRKLKIYAGPEHPHAAQAPKELQLAGVGSTEPPKSEAPASPARERET